MNVVLLIEWMLANSKPLNLTIFRVRLRYEKRLTPHSKIKTLVVYRGQSPRQMVRISGVASSISGGGGGHIHIFVFCIINLF